MSDTGALEDHRRGDRGQRQVGRSSSAGKDKAFNALVGQVMKASKGKANPRRPANC